MGVSLYSRRMRSNETAPNYASTLTHPYASLTPTEDIRPPRASVFNSKIYLTAEDFLKFVGRFRHF